jgi:hypothetical protein
MRARFVRTWQREATDDELRREVERHIREEILYREAVARGYDRGDLVVRRAMQQKMDMLAQTQAMQEPPTDEEVEAFFAMRREQYRRPAVLDFDQVYLNPDRRGESLEGEAAALLREIRAVQPEGEALAAWGDPIMMSASYTAIEADRIAGAFGPEFADAVVDLPVGEWVGPVTSSFGLHLVRVTDKRESQVPDLRDVSARVLADMEYEAGRAAKDLLYQEIAQAYRVVLDDAARELMAAAAE